MAHPNIYRYILYTPQSVVYCIYHATGSQVMPWHPGGVSRFMSTVRPSERSVGGMPHTYAHMYVHMYSCTKMCTIQYIIVLITATTIMKMYSNINNGNKTIITVCCNYNQNNNNSVKYAATTKTTASAYFLCIAATTATAPAVAATVASPAANSHLIELH